MFIICETILCRKKITLSQLRVMIQLLDSASHITLSLRPRKKEVIGFKDAQLSL